LDKVCGAFCNIYIMRIEQNALVTKIGKQIARNPTLSLISRDAREF